MGCEEFRLTLLQPLGSCATLALRTIAVAAGVVGDALVAAIAALLNMAAKGGGAASLDCAHSAMLGTGQRRSVLNAESRAEAAEHIRHLQPLASHGTLHAAAPIEAMAA
jgi:hypothetical protein